MRYMPADKDNCAHIVDAHGVTVAIFKTLESDETGRMFAAAPAMAEILSDFVNAWEVGAEFDTSALRRFVRRMRSALPDYDAPNAPERR